MTLEQINKTRGRRSSKPKYEEDSYATKSDIRELKADMRAFRTEMKTDMIVFRNDIKDEISGIKNEVIDLKGSLRENRNEFRWMMGLGFVILGLIIKFG